MYSNYLQDFFKENNIPVKFQKSILFGFEQSVKAGSQKTFKDVAEILIKCRISSKTKKNQLSTVGEEVLDGLIVLVFPDWNTEQLNYEVIINDIDKTVEINCKDVLTENLLNTIVNFK